MTYAEQKADYVAKINRYLHHKKVLSNNSYHYKKENIAASIRWCVTYFDLSIKDCGAFTLEGICQMVIKNQHHLRNILPAPKNPSYRSSVANVEQIIAFALNYKRA